MIKVTVMILTARYQILKHKAVNCAHLCNAIVTVMLQFLQDPCCWILVSLHLYINWF